MLPVNVGYNINGNLVACFSMFQLLHFFHDMHSSLQRQRVTIAMPVAIHLRYRIISISSFESVHPVLLYSSSSSSSLFTVSAPEWETHQTEVKGLL